MENTQRSASSFCRSVGCGHNRSMHDGALECQLCSCDRFVAPQSPEARAIGPKLVEPSPNARARDAAALLLRAALTHAVITRAEIEAALVCLEVIS